MEKNKLNIMKELLESMIDENLKNMAKLHRLLEDCDNQQKESAKSSLQILNKIPKQHLCDSERFFVDLQTYKNIFGNCNVPINYVTHDGYPLGRRFAYYFIKQHKLNPQGCEKLIIEKHAKMFKELDCNFDYPSDALDNFIIHYVHYVDTHDGDLYVSRLYISPDGYHTGTFSANLRASRRAIEQNKPTHLRLDKERIAKLESVHFPLMGQVEKHRLQDKNNENTRILKK